MFSPHLDGLLDGRLVRVRSVDLLTRSRDHSARLSVHLHQLAEVELRLLEDLHFANVHVLERVEEGARLLNVLADGVRDQLVAHLLQVARGHLKEFEIRSLTNNYLRS